MQSQGSGGQISEQPRAGCSLGGGGGDKYVSSHGLDAVSGGWGECHGMSTGENLGFTNLETVERNAFRKE